jgi:hypothetical protein
MEKAILQEKSGELIFSGGKLKKIIKHYFIVDVA